MLLLIFSNQEGVEVFPPAFTYDGAATRPAWFVPADWSAVGPGLRYATTADHPGRRQVGARNFSVLVEHAATGSRLRVPFTWLN